MEMEQESNLIIFTDQNFQEKVIENKNQLILVDFWAPWCGHCQMMAPIVEELTLDFQDNQQIKIGKMNIDENPKTAEKYNIMSIPNIKFFIRGQIIDESLGLVNKQTLTDKINKNLKE